MLQRLGDYTGAEVALRRALEIRETLGPEHLLVAKSLYNLGRLLQDRGEQGAASDLLKRSFNIRLARFYVVPDRGERSRDQRLTTHLRHGSEFAPPARVGF